MVPPIVMVLRNGEFYSRSSSRQTGSLSGNMINIPLFPTHTLILLTALLQSPIITILAGTTVVCTVVTRVSNGV